MSRGERRIASSCRGQTAKSLCLETDFFSTNSVKTSCFVCTKQLQRFLSPGFAEFPYTLTTFDAALKHCGTTTNLHQVGFTSSLYSVHYTLSLQDTWQMKCMVHCFSTDRVEVLCKGTYFNVFFPQWAQIRQAFSLPLASMSPTTTEMSVNNNWPAFFAAVVERLVCARNLSCFSTTQ